MFSYFTLFNLDGISYGKKIVGNPLKGIGKRLKRIEDSYLIARSREDWDECRFLWEKKIDLLNNRRWSK